jgi:hypothetical protein
MADRTCAIEPCINKAHARGWCTTHYRRWRLYGDPLALAQRKVPLAIRFWAKVGRRGPDDCWEWQAFINPNGYGTFHLSRTPKRMVLAHRMAWELEHGRPVPDGLFVCHHCDNRCCVNPRHLYAGTREQNMADMDRRGRRVLPPRRGALRKVS